jgi:hypothetical protein
VPPDLRQRHVPDRSLGCAVTDLDVAFTGHVDAAGLRDLTLADSSAVSQCDVRVSCASDALVALADGDDTFLSAWLSGRVHVSASMRDILRLRSLIGL